MKTVVYLAGAEGNVAKYWKDGTAVELTDGSRIASATAIAVVGNDVYVAGTDGNVAKYWKNGIAVELTDGSSADSATAISVVGNDVYIAGHRFNGTRVTATYWKNGKAVDLPDGNCATDIAVVGTDVHVVGNWGSWARYWKNGKLEVLIEDFNAFPTAIAHADNDVYITGYSSGRSDVGRYWINGKAVYLTDGSMSYGSITAIEISNNNIYLTGFENEVAQYWINNVATKLADGYRPAAIAVDGKDIYIAGNKFNLEGKAQQALYWKNGVKKDLPGTVSLNDIAIGKE